MSERTASKIAIILLLLALLLPVLFLFRSIEHYNLIKSDLQQCLDRSYLLFLDDWNKSCELNHLAKDCSLPEPAKAAVDALYKIRVVACYSD